MKRYFLDTSALVKIYHREAGSDFCLKIYAGQAHLIISELAKVELQSTIFRKFREKELNSTALRAVLEKFECDCEDRYEVLHVASPVYDEHAGCSPAMGNCTGSGRWTACNSRHSSITAKRSKTVLYALTKSFQRSLNMKMSRWFLYEKQGCF